MAKVHDLKLSAEADRTVSEQASQGKAVMEFVESIVGAYESGAVNSHMLSIGELHSIAQTHVKDHYDHDAPSIDEAWNDHDFACECFHGKTCDKLPEPWSLWKAKGSGQVHQVYTIANLAIEKPEYPTMVIYDDREGRRRSKTIGDFLAEFEYSEW